MTEYTHYTYGTHVVLLDIGKSPPVDGVEIETRKEREQRERLEAHFKQQIKQEMDRQLERAFYCGDSPAPTALPKPEP